MNALTIRNLQKTYDNGNQALKGIDLSVEAGDFYALLGPNGAGKTTAIGIVSSLVNKTGGEVEIFGHSIDTDLAISIYGIRSATLLETRRVTTESAARLLVNVLRNTCAPCAYGIVAMILREASPAE